MTRREAREAAFIMIFERYFQAELTTAEIAGMAKENGLFEANEFAVDLTDKVYNDLEEIDTLIADHLVRWSITRLSKVSLAVLRMCTAELLFLDTPVSVAINEAVEIAKKYAGKEDSSYVNGVLGKIALKVRP